jgi:tetratricopeptide (TPR) repeat protein
VAAAAGLLVLVGVLASAALSAQNRTPPTAAGPTAEVPTTVPVSASATGAAPTIASPPAPTAAPTAGTDGVTSHAAECASRMAEVDAVWNTSLSTAIDRLEAVTAWDASCGDASNKLYAALVNRANDVLRTDQPADALPLLQRARQRNPGGVEAESLAALAEPYVQGWQAVQRGDWPSATTQLKGVYAERPDFAGGRVADLLFRAYTNNGNALAALGNWAQARDQYQAALAIRPTDTQVAQALHETERQLTPPTPQPTPTPRPAPAAPVAPVDAGFWTVIVASEATRDSAERFAAELRQQGYDGEVLFSSDFSSLNPNYWVAYSGRFRDKASADQLSAQLKAAGFAVAYPREVRR